MIFLNQKKHYVFSITWILTFLIPTISFAQEIAISGQINDYTTGEILQFANVSIKNNGSIGTISDETGKFQLNLNQDSNYVLLITNIGYKTKSIPLNGKDTTLQVYMVPLVYSIQEVSIYSQKNRDDNLISINKIRSEKIGDFAGFTKDIIRTTQLMPGVSANNEANAKYNVRGGTFDENLVIVNGVRVNKPFHLKEIPNASVGIFNLE